MRAYGSVGFSFLAVEAARAAGKTQGTRTARRRTRSRYNEDRRANRSVSWSLLLFTVFAFQFCVLFYVAGFDRLQLQRTGGDHFEVRSALGAGDDLTLVNL